ncbi:uncharacterized protein LOC110458471 [Mizuhopecten yessoensis]|uniref:uncharacterized protein LOC110458471 n=1 Tax=Mizuhopecten yessoensis TaxID=6573 RepID=UPI000B457EFE|nr:uncharacterized protein LOC110458471 [Mizuhopecten yessoensis]XP_021365860.1 uncharacterized protein LOC110458471 [Mizuhopecten yessoensis]
MANTVWLILVCCVAVNAGEITLQTYNVGLNPRVENMEIRKDAVIPELRHNGSDVVCLQEIWRSGDVSQIIESLKDVYPYSLSPLHDETGSFNYRTFWPPCFSWTAVTFATCALTYCRNEPTEEDVVRCVVSCGFVDVSRECLSCVVIGGTFASLRACVYGFGYNYNPQGLLLLSKRPLYEGSVTSYFPATKTIAQRAYVKADVEDFGPVVCTHMTPYLGDFYLEPSLMDRFRGWADQSQYEAGVLVSQFARDPKGVIMGDLNTGPALPRQGVRPHMAASYNEFVFSHWVSPFVDRVGACTFCKENVLTFDNESWILDHVLMKGHNVLDTKLLHMTNIDGQTFPVSDHYGVEVTFEDEF